MCDWSVHKLLILENLSGANSAWPFFSGYVVSPVIFCSAAVISNSMSVTPPGMLLSFTSSSVNSVQDVHKCIHGTAPSCLAEMCTLVAASTGRRNLRSATRGNLLVPRTRTITYGPRSSAVSGLCVWNDLSTTLRASPGTHRQFQSTLKTLLFCLAYET